MNIFEQDHGLRTPNEGINQRYLKFWAHLADKICQKFGIGIEFSAVQCILFSFWASVVRDNDNTIYGFASQEMQDYYDFYLRVLNVKVPNT